MDRFEVIYVENLFKIIIRNYLYVVTVDVDFTEVQEVLHIQVLDVFYTV